jgi:RHS repeat-associated protein
VTDDGQSYYLNYDEFGNIASYLAGNGIGTMFGYDATQKVTNLNMAKSDGTVLISERYTYNPNGNRTSVERITSIGSEKSTYSYDSINQLTKETLADGTVNDYSYDGFGNRISVTVTKQGGTPVTTTERFNDGNQLTSFGNEDITYDADGNRLSDGQFTYKWDAVDQLAAVTRKGESNPFATYKYDDKGRRIEKTVNGQTTRFYYDGDSINVLYETDTSGNVLRQYVYGANGDRLAMKTQGQFLYYHYNSHGDVIAMTDQSGKVVASYNYDAWGNVISPAVQGIAADNPFGYSGYMYDKEIGMYYLIARYYNPLHGVFLSVDPDPGDDDDPLTQNGYSYASNNPIKLYDYDGRKQVDDVGGGGFGGSFSLRKPPTRYAGNNSKGTGKVPPQLVRGMKFEEKVLMERGLVKNTKKIGNSIPDSLTGGRITEIKDVKYVYKSKQFRDYIKDGRPIDLIANKSTRISEPLKREIIRSGGRIIRR